jgi:hypothetical protein
MSGEEVKPGVVPWDDMLKGYEHLIKAVKCEYVRNGGKPSEFEIFPEVIEDGSFRIIFATGLLAANSYLAIANGLANNELVKLAPETRKEISEASAALEKRGYYAEFGDPKSDDIIARVGKGFEVEASDSLSELSWENTIIYGRVAHVKSSAKKAYSVVIDVDGMPGTIEFKTFRLIAKKLAPRFDETVGLEVEFATNIWDGKIEQASILRIVSLNPESRSTEELRQELAEEGLTGFIDESPDDFVRRVRGE